MALYNYSGFAAPRLSCTMCGFISRGLFCVLDRGAARNFAREGPVTDVVRFQTLAILHKDHFDVTGQFLVNYNRIHRRTGRHFTGGRKKFALKMPICPKNKQFALKQTF